MIVTVLAIGFVVILWERILPLIAPLIFTAYLLSISLHDEGSVEKLGFIAFIAAAQFFPGTLALLYWPRANRNGLLGGLAAGFGVWLLLVIAPEAGSPLAAVQAVLPFGIADNAWAGAAVNSVALNALVPVALSYFSPQSREEREAAISCSLGNLSGPARHQLLARSPADFVAGLSSALGEASAQTTAASGEFAMLHGIAWRRALGGDCPSP